MVRDDDLLTDDLVEALGRSAEPLDSHARAQIRTRVMQEIRADRRGGLFMLASHRVAAGATALALLGGGVAYAAERSLPGDPLYGVKTAAEDVVVAVLPPGTLEDRLLVTIAARRARETATLARKGMASESVDHSLDALRKAVRRATPEEGELGEHDLLRIREQGSSAPTETRDAIDDAVLMPTSPDPHGGTGTGSGGGQSTPSGDVPHGDDTSGGGTGSMPGPGTDGTGSGGDTGGTDDGTEDHMRSPGVNREPLGREQSCETSGGMQPR